MNIKKSTQVVLTDLGLGVFFLLVTFSMLSYFTVVQTLVAILLGGFALGYIRQGEEGKTISKAAKLSVGHLFMAALMLFQWTHFTLFIMGFVAVYAGIIIELKVKEPKKKLMFIAAFLVPTIALAIWVFPHFISAQLSSKRTGFMPSAQLLKSDSTFFSTDELKHKIVIMDFWATWCVPCMEEMNNLQANWNRLDTAGVEFLFVNAGSERETFEKFQQFTDTTSFQFPFVHDVESEFTRTNRISAFPTLLIIDAEGTIRYQHVGYYKGEDIVGYLNDKITELKAKP